MPGRTLTPAQRLMLSCSGHDPRDGNGYGVQLYGAGNWRTARSLEALALGWIQGGHANGSPLPGLFFANRDGVAAMASEDGGDDT
jgi:hypothetical protein